MTSDATRSEPYEITVLLLDQFAMIAFSSTIEPLREANWLMGEKVYEWKVVSQDGNAVRASNGISINVDGSIDDVKSAAMVIVCSSFDPHLYATPAVLNWLRKLARKGARVGGIETGAYVLAKAGLLDGYRATIHWEHSESITESFAKVLLTDNLFEVDRTRFTSSGALATLDMMLHFITLQLGGRVAAAVADGFVYSRARQGGSPQRPGPAERMNIYHPRLQRLLKFFNLNLDRHLHVAEMATSENITDREVRRLFSTYLKSTPQAYHRSLRLQRARLMLRQTDISVTETAVSCGFASSSDFARAFKREFGQHPGADRRVAYFLERPADQRIPRDIALDLERG